MSNNRLAAALMASALIVAVAALLMFLAPDPAPDYAAARKACRDATAACKADCRSLALPVRASICEVGDPPPRVRCECGRMEER